MHASFILMEASALPLLCLCRNRYDRTHYHDMTNVLCAIHNLHGLRT